MKIDFIGWQSTMQTIIDDAEEMRCAFAEYNPAKDQSRWLFNFDPLTVALIKTQDSQAIGELNVNLRILSRRLLRIRAWRCERR